MARIKEPYVKVTERVRNYPTLLNIESTSTIAGVVVSPKGKDVQYISGPRDFLDKLVGADELPRNSHISLINAFYCSYFAGLVIARSMDKTGSVTFMHKLEVTDPEDNKWEVLPVSDGQVINTTAQITWDLSFDLSTTPNDGKWAYEFNGTVFYFGLEPEEYDAVVPALYGVTGPKAKVGSLDDIASVISSWAGFGCSVVDGKLVLEFNVPIGYSNDDVKNMLKFNTKYFSRYTTLNDEEEEVEVDGVLDINEKVKFDQAEIKGNYEDYLSITLSDSSLYDYRFIFSNPDVNGNYRLSIYKDSSLDSLIGPFNVSLNPMGKDEEGNSNFIENLNSQFEDIKFELRNDEEKSVDGLELGEALMSTEQKEEYGIDPIESAKPEYMSAAAYRLANQSKFAIDYLSDFGVTTTTFVKDLVYIGKENYWFTPIDIPYTYTNSASIKAFGDGIVGANSNQVMIAGPFDKNPYFLGFPCKIAWSSLFYERIFTNRANGSEFAPAFEQTNGVLNYTEPMVTLSDSDREALLNADGGPIDFVVYDYSNNLFYLNDNRCHTTTDNILSEECTRRLVNKINRDVKQIMNRFKGRVNDNETRAEVESILNLYMTQNIMNQTYKPDEVRVICDTSNNTDEIIVAHKLAVTIQSRLYGSIKFIDILSDVYPIGVDFTA